MSDPTPPADRKRRLFAGGAEKRAQAKAERERKKVLAERKKAMGLGVRYGGDRKRWLIATLLLGAMALASVLALVISLSRPSQEKVRQTVKDEMEQSGQAFPDGDAVMWAGQALRVWGTWDEGNVKGREVALAPFISSDMDPGAGWNGKGTQEVTYASVNPEPTVLGPNHAVVEAAYQIADGTWRCVSIPVYAYKPKDFTEDSPWAFTMSANPAPTSCAPRTGVAKIPAESDPLDRENTENNAEVAAELSDTFLPSFFSAWAASDTTELDQFTTSNVRTMGLGGAMASTPEPVIEDAEVFLPKGQDTATSGQTYKARVPVTWTVAGGGSQISTVYILPVRRDGGRWLVAGEPVAAPGQADAASTPRGVPAPDDGAKMPSYPADGTTPTSAPETVDPKSSKDSKSSSSSSSSSSSKSSASSSSSSSEPSSSPTGGGDE